MINWEDESCKVTPNFSVRECLRLPQWNRLADETDGLNDDIKGNLVILCEVLEKVRAVLQTPIHVHCMYRPARYNKLVGGASASAHMKGMAIDFDTNPGMSLEAAKARIRPLLERYGLRMEKGTDTWIHLDTNHPGPSGREFTA